MITVFTFENNKIRHLSLINSCKFVINHFMRDIFHSNEGYFKITSKDKIMIPTFKIVSFLEGLSYILLVFMAMPLKYMYEDPSYVKMLGMPHGVLFIAYIFLAVVLKIQLNWSIKTFLIVCALSLIPFGTFFVGRFLQENR